MPAPRDYYRLLGVSEDADDRVIKRAWRNSARTLHPDLPANRGNAQALRRFQAIKEAYEVLSDPVRRREYDESGSSPFLRPGSPWAETSESARSTSGTSADDFRFQTATGSGVADIFANLFGGASPPRKRADNPWDPGRLYDEAVADGGTANGRPAAGNGRAGGAKPGAAPAKGGRWGFDPEELAEEALRGDLAGGSPGDADLFEEPESPGPGGRRATPREAGPRREEAGRRGEDLAVRIQVPFRTAALGGVHRATVRVVDPNGNFLLEEVDIGLPAGFEDGGELLLRERGHHARGRGPRGSLRVTIFVEEDSIFRRSGRDVVVDLPLSPWEAATGCALEVPTLEGRQAIRVPPGVRSGQRLRLRGLGLPPGGGAPAGNQELVIQIQIPERLGAEALDLLKRLDALSDFRPRHRWEEPERG